MEIKMQRKIARIGHSRLQKTGQDGLTTDYITLWGRTSLKGFLNRFLFKIYLGIFPFPTTT